MGSKLAGGGAPRPSGAPQQNKDASKPSSGGLKAQGQSSQAKAPVDMGALSNVGQGNKTAAHVEARNFPSAKQTEGGNGAEPQKNLPTGVTPMSQPKPMGAVPFIGSPSLGQLLGTTLPSLVPGGSVLNNAPDIARGKFSTQTTGGLLGEGVDSLTGQKPGPQTGWSADPSMTPGRDRAQRGTTSRESFDQTTIGSTSSTASDDAAERPAARDAENFSDIQMADRRKPGLKQMLETMI